jgi:hypothetical protein
VKLWEDPEVQKPFWDNPKSPYRKLVDKAFTNYSKWWESTPIPKPNDSSKGMLPGDFAATIDKKGVKLGIVGLNSSFLQLKAGKVRKKLALHIRQFHQSCGGNGITWTNKHHVCLLMTHHPSSWLTSQAQQALDGGIHEPPQRFALHLFGHTHEPELRSVAIGGSDARRRLQGCSLFSFEE